MPKENNASDIQRAIGLLEEAIALLRVGAVSTQEHRPASPERTSISIDLELPIRAFAKRYAKNLSGAQKFALVVAHLAKGDPSTQVSLSDVESNWRTLTGFLGTFNDAHPTRARDNDWVDSAKRGFYHLRPSWKDALK